MKMSNKHLLLFIVIGLISACHKFDENTLFLHHPQAVLEHGVWEIQSYTINGEEHLGKTYRYTFYMREYNDGGDAIPVIISRRGDKAFSYQIYYKPTRIRGADFIGGIVVAFEYPHNAPQKYPVFTSSSSPSYTYNGPWKVTKLTPKQLKIKIRDSLNNEHIAILKKKIF